MGGQTEQIDVAISEKKQPIWDIFCSTSENIFEMYPSNHIDIVVIFKGG